MTLSLNLSYQSTETPADQISDGWHLTSGEWYDDKLVLSFQGTLPELTGASLVIGGHIFPLNVRKRDQQELELQLVPEALGLLGRPVSIAIRWNEGDDTQNSNPIIACNRAALSAELQISDDGDTLDRVGDLDLDDEEFERLLGELSAALMIDRRSVWQLAGRTPPAATDDDEALRLDYADIDYDLLRQHPKLQQYTVGGTAGQRYARSRLQIILSAITDHFRGLLDVPLGTQAIDEAITKLQDSDAETEDEREQEEEEKQRRRWSQARRVARILKSFIRRYLCGIRSPDFQELAGFQVIVQNYVIFAHILWRLFSKEWIEHEFVVNSLLEIWAFFWGDSSQAGYFWSLDEEQQAQVRQLVRGDQHSDAVLVAALYYSARQARTDRWEEHRFGLRDFWRETLCHPPFEITGETLEEAWQIMISVIPYEPPRPTAIVQELVWLAEFETDNHFLRELEKRHQWPLGSCRFDRVKVYRESDLRN